MISAVSRLAVAALAALLVTAAALPSTADPGPDGTVSVSVKVNALEVEITAIENRAPGVVLEAVVQNLSDRPLRDIGVLLAVTESTCLQSLGPSVHHRGRLGPESVLSVAWRLGVTNAGDCSDVVVLAQVSAVDPDGDILTMESDARVLQIPR